MAKSLYLASLEPESGKSLVALGLMEMLSRRTDGVGYFRPVIPAGVRTDARIELIADRYRLSQAPSEMYAYTSAQVERMLAGGRRDEVFTGILTAYKAIERQRGFVLCDGTDFTGVAAALEFEFNVAVANHVGAPVLALVNGHRRLADDIIAGVRMAQESLRAEGAVIAATVVNRVAAHMLSATRDALASEELGEDHGPLWVIPNDPRLEMPTMSEIADALGATEMHGRALDAEQEVSTFKVAAMSLPNFLDHVDDGALIITPGDRSDVILGTLASRLTPVAHRRGHGADRRARASTADRSPARGQHAADPAGQHGHLEEPAQAAGSSSVHMSRVRCGSTWMGGPWVAETVIDRR